MVSYAGLDPSVRQSSEKEVSGGITKEGSGSLRWALVQCANIAIRCISSVIDNLVENAIEHNSKLNPW